MEFNSPPPCPNTVTIRRNPHRKARATPATAPQTTKLRELPPFPNEEILSAQTPENSTLQLPSMSLPKSENIKVFLRIRPIVSAKGSGPSGKVGPVAEQAPRLRAKSVWPQNPTKKNTVGGAKVSKKKSSGVCIFVNDSHSVTLTTPVDLQELKRIKSETYGGFSHVFSPDSSQFAVFERMVKPMVKDFLSGRSGMLAALGPSGSGKTHTVFGSPRDPGMVPLALRHIFKEIVSEGRRASRSFYISIFEIYSERGKAEKLFDLLPDGGELNMQQSTVKGLQEVLISNAEQAESLIAQAVLKRATAMTNTNSQSSRSQCIINIHDVPQKCKGVLSCQSNSAVLTIIDLAGAEREKRTGNQGTRLLESNFINNTLMVFGLCLRSLWEHQKNPRKPLQKHFQNSMLTRYLRDYLEGKKRMTLILTAKSGDEDYLDTSCLLRQASPYMQIKYNEVEPSNMIPRKRNHQPSSATDCAKPLSLLEHSKRMRLVSNEDTLKKDDKSVDEWHASKEDASTICKSDASSYASLKSECHSQAQSERSHVIMQNFAKVLWNVLKQYNAKLKVAEMEIQSLKENIGCEKKKNLALETQLNKFKACCTCCQAEKGIADTESQLESEADESSTVKEANLNLESSSAEASETESISPQQNSDLAQIDSPDIVCQELLDPSMLSKDDTLDPSSCSKDDTRDRSSPKNVSSTKASYFVGDAHVEIEVENSCRTQRPKRRLMPSSSVLLRDLSTLELVDETDISKGNRGTRKLAADDMKRTSGSISLLRLLKSNLHL